jgi:sugar lactone lactonase YvrE
LRRKGITRRQFLSGLFAAIVAAALAVFGRKTEAARLPRPDSKPPKETRMKQTVNAARFAVRVYPVGLVGCALVLTFAAGPGCSRKTDTAEKEAAPPPLVSMTIADPTFKTPECVLYDADADVYLVSNINGSPLGKDNNGFISRVSPDGSVIDGHWIAGGVNGVGLDAPKGMTFKGDTLLVADVGEVRLFSRTTGAPLATWPIPGAAFLNDMATGPDGTVYVTDTGFMTAVEGFAETGTDALYRFGRDGTAAPVVMDPSLGHPNGITVDAGGVVVVTFGFRDVYRIDPATGTRTDLPKPPKGQLDGVVRLADGSLLMSSWEGQAVYRLDNAGVYTTVLDSVMSPADIGYDTKRGLVLIPVFMQNKIEVREVK